MLFSGHDADSFSLSVSECSISVALWTRILSGETMKLTLLSAMPMTAVVGITSANADYKNYCYRRCSLSGAGGVPRNVDKPANRIEDITVWLISSASITVLIAPAIGFAGICGGGGYSLCCRRDGKRFKSIATISMF